ncbi:MAG: hypothetical protein EA361_01840, partial [Bacteroidetes bacterium]
MWMLIMWAFVFPQSTYGQKWVASPEIIGHGAATISGYVFFDENKSGTRDAGEVGVSGVLVSNG